MSTTLERRKAKKKNAYAEFDEYISYQLRKTQSGIRSTDICTALCGAAVFVISYLLVFVVLDHWVVAGGFGNGMRAVLLVGMIVGTLAWIGWKVVWPFFRRVNSLYAAKALEEASPELKSTLLNYVDLRSAQREVAPAIIDSMEKRAAVTLSHAEVDDAIDRSMLLRLSYALLAAVVLFSVYSVVSPKKVWPSIVRIFAPTSEVSVSTQTAFLSVDPGDTKVLAREFLTVTADLSGEVPADVTLLYTTSDQQFVDEAVSMREVEAGLKRYQCILKGDGGEGLLQGLSYRIVAGDASTKTYNVAVAQPPSATVDELRYSFPDYMELPPEIPVGSNIDTWEGAEIEIAATANMVIESAKLQFSDEAEFPVRCEEIRMEVGSDGTSVTGLWQPIIRDDGTYPKFYRVQCRTKDNATDLTPVVHSIQIRPDEKPEVSTLQPRGDMEVAVNATIPLLINASDPDFRLSRVVLRMSIGKRELTPREIYKGSNTEERILYQLKIAATNAEPGDVITWRAEAHDNRRVETPVRTLLDANRSSTPRLKFIVKAPISEEEAREQLERDKERAQEKLDELDQRSNGDDLSSDDSNRDMPDSGEEPPTDADDRQPKSDAPDSEENSTSEQNSDGDESGTGGKGEGDSVSNSDSESGNKTGDQTGGSDTGSSKAGTDPERSDSESKPDGRKGESGSRKPVSNDGSQDDEILKELFDRNLNSKPEGARGEGTKEDGGNDQNSGEAPEGKKPDSNTGGEEPGTESSASKDGDTEDENDPDGPEDDPSSKKTDGNLAKEDMPGEGQAKPPKGDEPPKGNGHSESTDNPEKSAGRDDPSKTDDPSGTEPGDEPGDSSKTGKNNGSSDSEQSGDPSEVSESDMPKSDASSDGDGNDGSKGDSSSQSSDDPGGKDDSTEPRKRSDGENSQPGRANKSGQPGKPDGDSSDGQGGSESESASSDSGKGSGKPSAKDGSKSGAAGESSNKSPGHDSSKSTSDDGGKSGGDSASGKPGQSSAEKPGENASSGDPAKGDGGQQGKSQGSEAGSKTGNESSDEAGGQKLGEGDVGKPGKGDSPGKAGSKPGKGESGGSTINDGMPGSGKSNASSGKPGQSTGSKSSSSSDPGGEAVASPDDNANPDEAVQREKSGANAFDPNVKDADEANLQDKLKASNMVLKRLKEELDRGDVDPDLLKKLGWTEKDMQKFAERLERQLAQPKPNDPAAEARRRQFEEVLHNVDLESSGREKRGEFNSQKSTNNFSERRLPAPRSHRKAYEDYLKRLSQQRRGTASPAAGK